jgi:hypothetical protein
VEPSGAPPSVPPSVGGTTIGRQAPTSVPVELHDWDVGQPLPAVARQPGMQREIVASHTRPEVASPQSLSIAQPHEPPATQRAPAWSLRHADWFMAVHSTQVRVVIEQMNGDAQSASPRHCTQRFAPSVVSQRRVGIAQSPSPAQAALWQWPTPAATSTHVWPEGHPLRPGPQPGVQKPLGPLQITPEVGPPHEASPAAPSQPHRPVAGRH